MATDPSNLIGAAVTGADGAVKVNVKVVPGARRSRLAGLLGDRLKVQVAAPPEAGKANAALCTLLAQALQISARDVAVTQGQTQPRKTLAIADLPRDEVVRRLAAALA